MMWTVPCSKSECIYQNEGLCMLDTAKETSQNQIKDTGCLYYCTAESLSEKISSESPKQKL